MTDVRLISSYTPESFGRKLVIRHLLWGHIVRFGMPAIWFTLNPADLRSPLIMNLASTTQIPTTPATLETIRRTAVANPVDGYLCRNHIGVTFRAPKLVPNQG